MIQNFQQILDIKFSHLVLIVFIFTLYVKFVNLNPTNLWVLG